MKHSLLYLFLLLPSYILGQNSNFVYSTAYAQKHSINHVIETKDKNYIIILNSFSDTLSPRLLIKLNRNGQPIKTLLLKKDNYALYTQRIIELDSTILSIGNAYDFQSQQTLMFIGKTDKNLNAISLSLHPVPDGLQNINYDFDRDSNIIIGGGIQFKRYFVPRLFGAKLDKRGNFLSFTVKTPVDTFGFTSPYFGFFDAFKVMKDSAKYVFFDGHRMIVVDTSFNALQTIDMPRVDSVYWGLNPSVLRLNDTTYYVSTYYNNIIDRGTDLYFLKTTLSRQVKIFKSFGSKDTTERSNDFIGLDTNRLGEFYFGGTFNDRRTSDNYPFIQDTSQFVLYKLDKNHNLLWTKRYGQNGIYEMKGLTATSDGGCLMHGYRYNHNTIPRTEAYLIKVDGNGLVTSETAIPLSISTLQLSPNPGNGFVQAHLPNTWQSYDFRFFDYSGRYMKSVRLDYPNKDLDLSDLNSGLYIFHVFENGKIKHTGKWLKQ